MAACYYVSPADYYHQHRSGPRGLYHMDPWAALGVPDMPRVRRVHTRRPRLVVQPPQSRPTVLLLVADGEDGDTKTMSSSYQVSSEKKAGREENAEVPQRAGGCCAEENGAAMSGFEAECEARCGEEEGGGPLKEYTFDTRGGFRPSELDARVVEPGDGARYLVIEGRRGAEAEGCYRYRREVHELGPHLDGDGLRCRYIAAAPGDSGEGGQLRVTVPRLHSSTPDTAAVRRIPVERQDNAETKGEQETNGGGENTQIMDERKNTETKGEQDGSDTTDQQDNTETTRDKDTTSGKNAAEVNSEKGEEQSEQKQ